MIHVESWAIVVAAAASVVVGFTYYMMLGAQLAALSATGTEGESGSAWLIPIELARGLVVAAVVAGVAAAIGIGNWREAVLLGLALWVGFPVVLLFGSVIHEKVPWKVAAIHAGDWLIKLLVITVIVSVWH